MLYLILAMTGIGCAAGLYRWRWGVVAAVLIGLLQDPLRKMVPGVPGYLALTAMPVWLSALVSGMMSGELVPRRFMANFPRLSWWILVFAVYLLIPAALSASYGHNTWMITLLGAAIYAFGFVALVAGWKYPSSTFPITRILTVYAVGTALLLLGGPLDWLGFGERYAAIGTQVMGHLWVTHRTGEAVYMLAGFFRSPDVMGWHAAMLTMISGVMALRTRGRWRAFWIGLGIWGVMNIWLCGRRKMISMIPVFWGCFLLQVFYFRDVRRAVPALGVLLMFAGLGWYVVSSSYHTSAVDTFYLTVLDELDERAWQHGVTSVKETLNQSGFWGQGLGFAQQGAHHIRAEKPHIWQESGPSKIAVELGFPGLILFLVVNGILLATAWRVIRIHADQPSFDFYAGLFAVIIANLASGIVSAQIFGDPFIILWMAFIMGLLLSGGRPNSGREGTVC